MFIDNSKILLSFKIKKSQMIDRLSFRGFMFWV